MFRGYDELIEETLKFLPDDCIKEATEIVEELYDETLSLQTSPENMSKSIALTQPYDNDNGLQDINVVDSGFDEYDSISYNSGQNSEGDGHTFTESMQSIQNEDDMLKKNPAISTNCTGAYDIDQEATPDIKKERFRTHVDGEKGRLVALMSSVYEEYENSVCGLEESMRSVCILLNKIIVIIRSLIYDMTIVILSNT